MVANIEKERKARKFNIIRIQFQFYINFIEW